MDTTTEALLWTICFAGLRVEIVPWVTPEGDVGGYRALARDDDGDIHVADAPTEREALVELAHSLGFEDLD